jgi:hypothetical protein
MFIILAWNWYFSCCLLGLNQNFLKKTCSTRFRDLGQSRKIWRLDLFCTLFSLFVSVYSLLYCHLSVFLFLLFIFGYLYCLIRSLSIFLFCYFIISKNVSDREKTFWFSFSFYLISLPL